MFGRSEISTGQVLPSSAIIHAPSRLTFAPLSPSSPDQPLLPTWPGSPFKEENNASLERPPKHYQPTTAFSSVLVKYLRNFPWKLDRKCLISKTWDCVSFSLVNVLFFSGEHLQQCVKVPSILLFGFQIKSILCLVFGFLTIHFYSYATLRPIEIEGGGRG